jgi:hypothetical protein
MEIIPHVVNPCLAADLAGEHLPRFCERTERGPDLTSRLHTLDHALVGAWPMVLLYRWALRRWRPDVLTQRIVRRGRTRGTQHVPIDRTTLSD